MAAASQNNSVVSLCGRGRLAREFLEEKVQFTSNCRASHRPGRPSLRGHFRPNMAFTCAVTEMDCGVNSSVGAGAPATLIFIIAPAMGMGRTFSNVSTDA